MGIKNSFFEWMVSYFSAKKDGKTLRIIGSNSLKHPCGDIDFVKVGEKEVVVALNEMSLCGADSPLPDKFLRDIRTENENSFALLNFLNMLQHYLAMLRFNAISGRSSFFDKKWQSRFALYNEAFSCEMLRCFFAKMFPNAQIFVHCFEPLRIENPAPVFLGRANLSGAMLLGKNCTSLTSAMRVDICGISLEQSIELRRKKDFLNVKFPFKIKVVFSAKASGEICCLGKQNLSENFWLGCKNFKTIKLEKTL